ncbi:MAG: response regulator [Caldilineaceae bacterium]
MVNQTTQILLVEDDEIDAEAIVRSFRRQQIANPITIVQDGIEALQCLRGENGYTRLPWPYLILLDINMPRMNGIEFLEIVRRDVELKQSVVFVLTTSNRDEDKLAAYNAQIAGYLLKARAGKDFIDIITLLGFYERLVEFPPESAKVDKRSQAYTDKTIFGLNEQPRDF